MIGEGLIEGLRLLASPDPEVWGPIRVSVTVSLTSTVLATTLALPAALVLSLARFPGRRVADGLLGALMALPTVLVGLVVFAFIRRAGPLGTMELLYTPAAMVLGQAILAWPVITGLTAAALDQADPRVRVTLLGLGAGFWRTALGVAASCRGALVAAVVSGFGRVFAEVGISMMLGGNIRGSTRNITTGIAFETGRGEFARGVALGVVLLAMALAVNLLLTTLRGGRRS
ncbi:MAG: ABC transporter permease [Deltaproteobacteria bacterium]|nr:ABC transporter permease [Deltaproteobacteria bacterium]